MRKLILSVVMVLLALPLRLLAGELHLIIAPQSTTLTAEGYFRLDVYVYNDSNAKVIAPAPEAEFKASWTLRDAENIRPRREGSHSVFGTDTLQQHALNAQTAVKCEVGDRILTEPGDILELYITVDSKSKSGQTTTLQSNSVLLFRPK
jgi:hypothetical protein